MSIRDRTLYAYDCLEILNDEVALPSGSVDLIYLDPPFNSKSNYNLPFKGNYKNLKPVKAFTDTWTWGDQQDRFLRELESGPSTRKIAEIVKITSNINKSDWVGRASLSAYLINMAVRLIPMKRVLKNTGTICLHCDPTASHYLKLVMDAIWERENFLNEIVWHYGKWTNAARHFQKNHDTILCYASSKGKHAFNKLYGEDEREHYKKGWHTNVIDDGEGRVSQLIVYDKNKAKDKIESGNYDRIVYREGLTKVALPDVFDIPIINPMAKERLGYPTQKPLALLNRIVGALSNEGDVVLDPFCGCGTTVHASEMLKRNWIGIDISNFSVGLVRERILNWCITLNADDIKSHGLPNNKSEAEELAKKDKFEFEKWICGAIGAHGMFHDPGDKGPDGGVDGVIEFFQIKGLGEKVEKGYAIVQVKGGKVTPDSVKALYSTVKKYGASAGIFVCFEKYMSTVERQRNKETFKDMTGKYDVIQGFSVEQLLNNEKPVLPPIKFRDDARLKTGLLAEPGLI